MTWIKIDDQFLYNIKIVQCSKDSFLLYFASVIYLSQQLTDGFIPRNAIPFIAGVGKVTNDIKECVDQLVTLELWEKENDGYKIIDWLGCSVITDKTVQELRNSSQYRVWRRYVLERDKFTCVKCGEQPDVKKLHAHHIKEWARFPKFRFRVDNGTTLCETCHLPIHYLSSIKELVHVG